MNFVNVTKINVINKLYNVPGNTAFKEEWYIIWADVFFIRVMK